MNYEELGSELVAYCRKYKIPVNHFFDILHDQKVVPMLRGKATEFTVYDVLLSHLSKKEWSVEKLNINAQPGVYDEDITIRHKRSNIAIKVECKSAVRGSIMYSNTANVKEPHCKIKCHRSRSNKKKKENDRYHVDDFDIIVSNFSNSIIKASSLDDSFNLVDTKSGELGLQALSQHYKVPLEFKDLFDATHDDWRFVLSSDIGVSGFLPRTPVLMLQNDPFWKPIKMIEDSLRDLVTQKKAKTAKKRK